MLEILLLHREHELEDVHNAVAMALELGCLEAGAIAVLVRQLRAPSESPEPLENLGELDAHGEAIDHDMSPYDRLVQGAWA